METRQRSVSRRDVLRGIGCAWVAATISPGDLLSSEAAAIVKKIPKSGESLPVIGMGTSRTFDVATSDTDAMARLGAVLQRFFDDGGTVIDSSPMYGAAESVVGQLLKKTRGTDDLFAATKVWIEGKQAGIDQMEESMRRMGVESFDLMQIHNLKDWKTHIETLREWKERRRIRYIGITTSHGRAHDEFARIMNEEPLDFAQFSYSIGNRTAEERLLPLAADRGIATMINRPFERGALFEKVRGEPVPEWASAFGCSSWGQFFLKFVVSHPAVTCAIPATGKIRHMADNMGAGLGRLPDAEERDRMLRYYEGL